MNIQFVSNEHGAITAVQIPIKEWKKIESKLAAFNISESIKAGYSEMLQIESGRLDEKTVEQFLSELTQ
jgi:hypothetical protein